MRSLDSIIADVSLLVVVSVLLISAVIGPSVSYVMVETCLDKCAGKSVQLSEYGIGIPGMCLCGRFFIYYCLASSFVLSINTAESVVWKLRVALQYRELWIYQHSLIECYIR